MAHLKEFTALIREHHASLRFFIQGLGVNPSWVDDMAQDAFLVAYRKWDEVKNVENPGAWLRTVARNLVLNETAKLNRRQRLLDENLAGMLAQSDDEEAPSEGIERLAELATRKAALRECLSHLAERTREVVEARYFRDRNSTQIAADLVMKPAAVRKILFHARHALAECLKGKSATHPA